MKNLFGILILSLVLLSSCSKSGDFELNIRPVFQQEALVLNEVYTLGAINLKFENLTFYLSDISLTNEESETVSLSDIEFISLNAHNTDAANSGVSLSFNDLPAGTYDKISFSIGVPDDLNAMTPSDFNVSDDLGRTDHYWEDWGSYIFSKIEGNADVEADGVFDLKFFYHTGSDGLFRSFDITEPIVIDNDTNTKFELVVDYNELLKNGDGTYLDIENFPRNHNPEELDIIIQLVNNYINAIKYVK